MGAGKMVRFFLVKHETEELIFISDNNTYLPNIKDKVYFEEILSNKKFNDFDYYVVTERYFSYNEEGDIMVDIFIKGEYFDE